MTATDVGGLVQATRRYLTSTARHTLNRLSTSVDADDLEFTLAYEFDASLGVGALVSIDDEICYVWQTDENAKSVTVERGFLGTTAAAHTAPVVVEINARFPQAFVKDALYEEIVSWPRSVYATAATTLAVPSNSLGVNLDTIPSDFIDILEVLRKPTATANDVYTTSWPEVGFRYERNMATSEFASGSALFLKSGFVGGATIRVVYSKPFDVSTFTNATTLATIGLDEQMFDIPPLGAAARLLAGKEPLRTQLEAQGEARNFAEVRPGETLRSATGLLALRDRRLADEGNRLLGRYGWRMSA